MSIKFFTNIDINGYTFYKNFDKELVLSNNNIDIVAFSSDYSDNTNTTPLGPGTTSSGTGTTSSGIGVIPSGTVATLSGTNNFSNMLVYNKNTNEMQYISSIHGSNGYVGIGCNPQYPLDVAGNLNVRGNISANSFITESDKRLKEDIILADLKKCEETVKNLSLHRYKWKETSNKKDHHELGWIAQEVQEIFPNSVHQTPEDHLFLSKDQIYAAMYGALQSALLSIDSLKERISILELK